MGTDVEIVRSAQAGDRAAFDRLIDGCGERLRRVAYGILRDRNLADDAIQRTFLAIWQDLGKLREPERFDAWSYRVLARACGAEAKRAGSWIPGHPIEGSLEPTTDADVRRVADRDQLERGFRRLSVEHRTVIVLHHYLDLPIVEVAMVMGASRGTTYSRLHYALRALRAALEADGRVTPSGQVVREVMS